MRSYRWTKKNIEEYVIKKYRDKQSNPIDIQLIIENNKFIEQPFQLSTKINNKDVFIAKSKEYEIILSLCKDELEKVFNVRVSNRNTSIANLKTILQDRLSKKAYKLDIKGFYENINCVELSNIIKNNPYLDFKTKSYIVSFLSWCTQGLPRGLSISAILSEIFLQKFDTDLLLRDEVLFFVRYVDDMVIITTETQNTSNFMGKLSDILPNTLEFNQDKKAEILLDENNESEFDFLGYKFQIRNCWNNKNNDFKKEFRKVRLGIADKKVKKIKTRLVKSFLDYKRNTDFPLLNKRILFLTKNYIIQKNGRKVKSGIYYNYSLIDDAESLLILDDLDKFLRLQINLSTLNREDKFKLYRARFKTGFEKKQIVSFSLFDLKQIKRYW